MRAQFHSLTEELANQLRQQLQHATILAQEIVLLACPASPKRFARCCSGPRSTSPELQDELET